MSDRGAETDRAYDAFAPQFRAYSEAKAAYVDAVDRIVTRRIPPHATSLLDVGAGDGARAVRLARARGLGTVVLVEPSPALAARCLELPVTAVWRARAEALPDTSQRFDVVVCLWNVLGHVAERDARVRALIGMRAKLADRAALFVDVNNRYNASAYGWARTLGRFAYDLIRPSETNGDVEVVWTSGDAPIRFRSHVFTPREIERLFADSGLTIRNRWVVDYRTGAERRRVYEGQLLYELGV
jgi:SAM-dependent methyltransferase